MNGRIITSRNIIRLMRALYGEAPNGNDVPVNVDEQAEVECQDELVMS